MNRSLQTPLRRDEQSNQREALLGIADFCSCFSEPEIQHKMNIVAKTCLTTDAIEFATAEQRQDIRYVFEQLAKVLTHIYHLNPVQL